MDIEEIKTRLQKVFRTVFDDDTLELFDEMSAKDIEEWDSLTHVQLIIATEKDFKVKFKTAEVSELKNVGEFMRLIGKKLENKR